MTTIYLSTLTAKARAAPKAPARTAAYDRARTCIILLVLIHHSILPYTYNGHASHEAFSGFDAVATFNDSFFMAAMFLLSGLFVWPGLRRKGVGDFLRDRSLRLGLPFAIAALILMPIAYYADEPRGNALGFPAYWWKTVTVGPWHSGPAWFIAVLLMFDGLAAVVYRAAPVLVEAIGEMSLAGLKRPQSSFRALLIGSIIAFVPAELYFGAARWLAIGPFSIQASRILLYLLYFFAGVGIGSVRFDHGLLAEKGELARRWPTWLAASIAGFGCLLALLYASHNVIADADAPPLWWSVAYAFAFALFSAAQTFNLLALFLRFGSDGWNSLDPLRESSYGIYLIHYVPVLWLQYALSGLSLAPATPVSAILKAGIVLMAALALSWSATVALRSVPGVARVL